MHQNYLRKTGVKVLAASSLFVAAFIELTGNAQSFELAQNPDVPTCTNFFNRGQLVELPNGNGVATNGNCNPRYPTTHYTAEAVNSRVIRITGEKTCDFVLQPDGVHLIRQRCWPNAQP